jgi:hypothetical protein
MGLTHLTQKIGINIIIKKKRKTYMIKPLEKFILSKFIKTPKKEFDLSVKGFKQAILWCRTQPHPFIGKLNLWDYIKKLQLNDELRLQLINIELLRINSQ